MKGLAALLIFVLVAFILYRVRQKNERGKDLGVSSTSSKDVEDLVSSITDKTPPVVETMAKITDSNLSALQITPPEDVNSRVVEKEKSKQILEFFETNKAEKGTLVSEMNSIPSVSYNPSVIPQSLVTGY